MSEFLVIGLNPAWQKLAQLQTSLQVGDVHRVKQQHCFASGKGLNVAQVLNGLGFSTTVLQFVGGETGKLWLQDVQAHDSNLNLINIPTQSETRICTTYRDAEGQSTEIIEPSPELNSTEQALGYEQIVDAWWNHSKVLLCGTAPNSWDWNVLATKIEQRHFQDPWSGEVFVDAWHNIQSFVQRLCSWFPVTLKINQNEFKEWGSSLPGVWQQYGFVQVVVTAGSNPVKRLDFTEDLMAPIVYKTRVNSLASTVNVIGAGDAFLAGLAVARSQRKSWSSSVDYALQVAAAKCHVFQNRDMDFSALTQGQT